MMIKLLFICAIVCFSCTSISLKTNGCVCTAPEKISLDEYQKFKFTDKTIRNKCLLYAGDQFRFYQYFIAATHSQVNNYFIEINDDVMLLSNNPEVIEEETKSLGIRKEDLKKVILEIKRINKCVSQKKGNKF